MSASPVRGKCRAITSDNALGPADLVDEFLRGEVASDAVVAPPRPAGGTVFSQMCVKSGKMRTSAVTGPAHMQHTGGPFPHPPAQADDPGFTGACRPSSSIGNSLVRSGLDLAQQNPNSGASTARSNSKRERPEVAMPATLADLPQELAMEFGGAAGSPRPATSSGVSPAPARTTLKKATRDAKAAAANFVSGNANTTGTAAQVPEQQQLGVPERRRLGQHMVSASAKGKDRISPPGPQQISAVAPVQPNPLCAPECSSAFPSPPQSPVPDSSSIVSPDVVAPQIPQQAASTRRTGPAQTSPASPLAAGGSDFGPATASLVTPSTNSRRAAQGPVPDSSAGPTKRRAPREISGTFEFRPSSRSSSESGTPKALLSEPQTRTLAHLRGDAKGRSRRNGTGPSSHHRDRRRDDTSADKDKDKDKNMGDRAMSCSSSIASNRPSLTTCYVNFDKFDLQIENGQAMTTKLTSWDQLLSLAVQLLELKIDIEDWSVRQAIDWYGWESPTKFQAVAIPCILQACCGAAEARSYTLLQAAARLGKTSSVALGMLASLRPQVKYLQYLVLALDACDDISRYLQSLGCLSSFEVVYLKENDNIDSEADALAVQNAQVLVGGPGRVCAALQAAQGRIELSSVEVMFIDDAAALIADGWVQKVCEINQLLSLFSRKPLRYVVVSSFVEREAKPALRALKSSLMNKKNMFDLSQQVGRIRDLVKHYLLLGDPSEWLSTLVKLREMIYIPRAVIFCDDDERFATVKRALFKIRHRDVGGAKLSVAINDSTGDQSQKERRDSLQAFCREQHDFLLTRSEPNIFQASIPRVFWIVHFGVEQQSLPWYGCRLLCLDSSLRERAGKNMSHEGVSMCFLPKSDEHVCPKLEKMFGIKFESLPFGDI